MLTKADWLHLLDAIESAEVEFEELVSEKEWYVTAVTDKLASAKQIVIQEIAQQMIEKIAYASITKEDRE